MVFGWLGMDCRAGSTCSYYGFKTDMLWMLFKRLWPSRCERRSKGSRSRMGAFGQVYAWRSFWGTQWLNHAKRLQPTLGRLQGHALRLLWLHQHRKWRIRGSPVMSQRVPLGTWERPDRTDAGAIRRTLEPSRLFFYSGSRGNALLFFSCLRTQNITIKCFAENESHPGLPQMRMSLNIVL